MGAERRHVIVVGLEVTDDATYACYRAGMTPILQEYGGAFEYDFVVAKVLKSPSNDRINRVFTISFPDRATRERFFADARYTAVRAEFFDPAVASRVSMAEFDT